MMAMLLLPGPWGGDPIGPNAVPLRQWLDGRWAVLLSHPEDFVQCDLELDRWLAIVRQAFVSAEALPLSLARPSRPRDPGWVSGASGTAQPVVLHEPEDERGSVFDIAAHRLRTEIAGMTQRFAMIIDATLRRRRTYVYTAAERPPSPLDLTCAVRKLRDIETVRESSRGAQCFGYQ